MVEKKLLSEEDQSLMGADTREELSQLFGDYSVGQDGEYVPTPLKDGDTIVDGTGQEVQVKVERDDEPTDLERNLPDLAYKTPIPDRPEARSKESERPTTELRWRQRVARTRPHLKDLPTHEVIDELLREQEIRKRVERESMAEYKDARRDYNDQSQVTRGDVIKEIDKRQNEMRREFAQQSEEAYVNGLRQQYGDTIAESILARANSRMSLDVQMNEDPRVVQAKRAQYLNEATQAVVGEFNELTENIYKQAREDMVRDGRRGAALALHGTPGAGYGSAGGSGAQRIMRQEAERRKAAQRSIDDEIVDAIIEAEPGGGTNWPSPIETTPEGRNLKKLLSGDFHQKLEKLD